MISFGLVSIVPSCNLIFNCFSRAKSNDKACGVLNQRGQLVSRSYSHVFVAFWDLFTCLTMVLNQKVIVRELQLSLLAFYFLLMAMKLLEVHTSYFKTFFTKYYDCFTSSGVWIEPPCLFNFWLLLTKTVPTPQQLLVSGYAITTTDLNQIVRCQPGDWQVDSTTSKVLTIEGHTSIFGIHFEQWHPGGNLDLNMSTLVRSSQFKQWDPGKFSIEAKFYNLEDKVDLQGVGNDTILKIRSDYGLLLGIVSFRIN